MKGKITITILHKAESRGHANYGWLDTHYSFSFAEYYNPERMNFWALRVLNDDIIAGGKWFGTHSHDNMEIITIPLEGDLEHKDSMGNTTVIKENDVQVMSAGKGILHSEYNKNTNKEVKLLQIWILPNQENVEPRYDQISLKDIEKKNIFYQIVSPNKDDQGVRIHQDAWFHTGNFTSWTSEIYTIKKRGNGIYIFILEGEVEIEGEILQKRDALGISNTDKINVKVLKESRILIMEVPMI